jgi:hypothetical protein
VIRIVDADGVGGDGFADGLSSRLVCHNENEDEGGQTKRGTKQQQDGEGACTFQRLFKSISTLFRF